jgi:hypothetical protein
VQKSVGNGGGRRRRNKRCEEEDRTRLGEAIAEKSNRNDDISSIHCY